MKNNNDIQLLYLYKIRPHLNYLSSFSLYKVDIINKNKVSLDLHIFFIMLSSELKFKNLLEVL